MRNIFKYFKRIIIIICSYIYTNRLFLTYFLLSLCGTIILRNVTINTSFVRGPIYTDVGLILLIGSFGYLVSYILLTFIITMIGKLDINYRIEIALFVFIYLALCIITSNLFRKDKIRI